MTQHIPPNYVKKAMSIRQEVRSIPNFAVQLYCYNNLAETVNYKE